MRQKKEEYDEVFKRSKQVERSVSSREEQENGRRNRMNELITIRKELKEQMADLRKDLTKMKNR